MGIPSHTNPERRLNRRVCFAAAALLLAWLPAPATRAQTSAPATAVPLILPAGLVYDAAGNLLFAESGRHLIRRVSPAGLLTTVAGTGTQGFAGDGGPATAALLDTPTALALDPAGDIFFADSHNHRIRRIDGATGTITTAASPVDAAALVIDSAGNITFADTLTHQVRRLQVSGGAFTTLAGNGTQGFAGDGGPALAASLDSPGGLAFNAAGDLLIADTHNHRIRRVDATSGIITTLTASAAMPRGLAVDSAGNLLFADPGLQQILRVAPNGSVSVVAGTGTENFAGDGSPAPAALLDSPSSVTLSSAGLPTLADSANGRVRQVDAASIIHTLAGLGASNSASLTLGAPAVVLYGSGSLTATLASSPATGEITFFDTENPATPQTLGSAALVSNTASFSAGGLPAGPHRLLATYPGDPAHPSAQSNALSLSVSPVNVTGTLTSFSILYGQPVPALTGTLAGALARDAASVSLALVSAATSLSRPGSYPIAASLTGSAAGNYTLTAAPAAVTISQAPANASLDVSLAPALRVQVASTTSGQPTGLVTLLDGANAYGSGTLSAGSVTFNAANLSPGSHTLTASYTGDSDFLPALSSPGVLVVAPASLPDFTLAANGATAVSVPAGAAAQYSFAVTPVNGALASPILLAASGLPPGSTASFNPAYLPPSNAPATFVLTVTTPKAALTRSPLPYAFALFLPVWLLARRRRRQALILFAAILTVGCGDRVNNSSAAIVTEPYTITVTATATQSTGATLQHTATVTLNLQH